MAKITDLGVQDASEPQKEVANVWNRRKGEAVVVNKE